MTTNKNPFTSVFTAWAEKNPFAANFEFDKYVASVQSNAKAFSEIAKATSDSLQALSSRQIEIAQKNAEELSKFIQDVAFSTKNVEEKVAKQADFVRSTFSSAISNSSEIIEAATKFSAEAGEIVSKKTSEALSEFTANKEKKKQAA